jgi:VCBS repeat-containing protein
VTTDDTGPEIPSGFLLSGVYYDIVTNAGYGGNITICLEYDPSGITGAEEDLRLYHYHGDTWTDVSTSLDTGANRIYCQVSALSLFAVLEPPLNSPPAALDDAFVTDQDDTLDVPAPGILANDTDPDGDALTAVLQNDTSHGTLALNADGSFTYTPVPGYYGADNFTYIASDGAADSHLATVSLTVHQDNSAGVFPSFTVRYMTINQANNNQSKNQRFSKWFSRYTAKQDKPTFSLWGRLRLPEGYTVAELDKYAAVTISIDQSSGEGTTNFQELNLRKLGIIWTSKQSEQNISEYMNITKMTVLWYPDSSHWAGWAMFYLRGTLELPDDIESDTLPLKATVTLGIPVTADGGGNLVGEDTVECKITDRSNRWQ